MFSFRIFFQSTRELEYYFFLSHKARIFFSEFNIRLYDNQQSFNHHGKVLITAVKPPVLYQIKDRKSESWIHHDRLKLCEDRELSIWLKHQRNELMNETVENEEFDLTGLYEEDAAAMSASDTLMSPTGSDQDNAIASAFLLLQKDNGQGSASAPDLLVSRVLLTTMICQWNSTSLIGR